jgi:hypothetical protein
VVNSITLESGKIIEKLQKTVNEKGIEVDSLVSDLKSLREIAVDKKHPRLAMTLRLTCEHLAEEEGFMIPIPEEMEVDEEGNEVGFSDQGDLEENVELQKESLNYLFAIMSDTSNKSNYAELKEYNNALKDY